MPSATFTGPPNCCCSANCFNDCWSDPSQAPLTLHLTITQTAKDTLAGCLEPLGGSPQRFWALGGTVVTLTRQDFPTAGTCWVWTGSAIALDDQATKICFWFFVTLGGATLATIQAGKNGVYTACPAPGQGSFCGVDMTILSCSPFDAEHHPNDAGQSSGAWCNGCGYSKALYTYVVTL